MAVSRLIAVSTALAPVRRVALPLAATVTLAAALSHGADAAPAFRESSSAATKTPARSLTIARPAGTVAGDVMLAAIDARRESRYLTPPTGWQLVRVDQNAGATATFTKALYVRVVGPADPPSYTWTLKYSGGVAGAIVAYAGIDTTAPIAAHSGAFTANTSSVRAPSLTTTVSGSTLVALFGSSSSGATATPATMTTRFDTSTPEMYSEAASAGADETPATVGPTGDRMATASEIASSAIGQLVALRPAGGSQPDTMAPSAPAEVGVTARTTSSVTLTWKASSDDMGVAGYGLYRNGGAVGTTPSTSYTFAALACGTSYTLAVDAFDKTGNRSDPAVVSTSTAACMPPPADTTPPTTPTGLTVTGVTASSATIAWNASSDNVGITGYGRYRDGSLVSSGQGTNYSYTGLACGTSYTLGVDAYDAAANRSARATVTASTSACSPPPSPPPAPPTSGCPVLATPTPVPGYCTGRVISVTPSTFGAGLFGSGGISVSPGDVVVFEDGTYTDTDGDGAVLRIRASGTSAKWVTFVSRTKHGAHIWGNDNDAAEGISLDGADYVRVEGFEVSDLGNVGSPRGSSSGIDLYDGGYHSQIVGNHIHHIGRVCANSGNTNGQVGIYVQSGRSGEIVIENNLVQDIGRFFVGENGCGTTTTSLDHGMYLNGNTGGGGGAGNVTIRNNIFQDTHHGWGIQLYPGSLDNIRIANNTFAFCNETKSYTCIVLDAQISNSSIRNNVFYNPQGGKTIEAAGFDGSITIASNITSGIAMHDQGSTPGGMTLTSNLLGTDARLVNPPADFRLQAGSPAIDGGETLSWVTIDYAGASRPRGAAHDVGAFES